MTTLVEITCPGNSHWPIEIITEDKVYDPVEKKLTDEWRKSSSITIRQGGSHQATVWHSRRLVIEEVVV